MNLATPVARLRAAAGPEDAPLTVHVAGADGQLAPLTLVRLTRVLPGRRIAGVAEWEGNRVFAKLFVGERAHDEWLAEVAGHTQLERLGAHTPALLLRTSADGGMRLCVYELLTDAVTLARALDERRPDEALSLLEDAVVLLARCHRAGLRHADPHLDNFMARGPILYAVDAADVQLRRPAGGRAADRRNLARLLATLPAAWDVHLEHLARRYLMERGCTATPAVIRRYLAAIHGRKRRALRKYLRRKILRPCTEFDVFRGDGERYVYRRADDGRALRQLLTELAAGNVPDRAVREVDGRRVMAIRCPAPRFGVALPVASPGRRVWQLAHLLAATGVCAHQPIALVETGPGVLVRESHVAVLPVPGVPLPETLAQMNSDQRRRTAEQCARLLGRMLHLGVRWRTLSGASFLLDADRLCVADLTAFRWRGRWWSAAGSRAQSARLEAALETGL